MPEEVGGLPGHSSSATPLAAEIASLSLPAEAQPAGGAEAGALPPPPTSTPSHDMTPGGIRRNPRWYKQKTSRRNATKSQRKALRELFPKYGKSFAFGERVSDTWVEETYGRGGGIVLDIGFGCGDALVEMARDNPEVNYLGIDWHTPGVGKCIIAIEKAGLTNVRVMASDAVTFLRQNLCEGARIVSGANVYFPDPWERDRRVNSLRVVRPEFAYLLASHCVPGARLHVATDVPGYPDYAEEVLRNAGWSGGAVPRPDWRPETPYELKGRAAGRSSVDLFFYSPERPAPVPQEFLVQVGAPAEEEADDEESAEDDGEEPCHPSLFD